jgi:hypothetical protein
LSSKQAWDKISSFSTLFWAALACTALLALRMQEQEPSLTTYIRTMTLAGVSEMCEVWVQDPAAVVEAFAALGFDSWEVPHTVREACDKEVDA